MARYNKIFAGPATEVTPQVRELPAADGNIVPGNLLVINSGEFTRAGASAGGKLWVAQDNYLAMKGTDDAYAEDDVVIGMEMLPGQLFNARVATGNNVAVGSALTTAANGALALAGDEDFVVAHAEEAFNNTSGSAQLVRVRAAVGYYTPAAAG